MLFCLWFFGPNCKLYVSRAASVTFWICRHVWFGACLFNWFYVLRMCTRNSCLKRLCVMAGRLCTAKHVNEKTQFDSINSRIDINLKMGTPGENLLSKSKELMKKAALHRLVGLHTFCHIGSLRSVATVLNLVALCVTLLHVVWGCASLFREHSATLLFTVIVNHFSEG